MSKSEECRLCGNTRPVKAQLTDKIKGQISTKELVEFFCRIELEDSNNFPTAVCQECYELLFKFSRFTNYMEKLQNEFKNRLPKEEHPVPTSRVAPKRKYEDSPQDTDRNESSPSGLNIKRQRVLPAAEKEKIQDKQDTNIAECLQEVRMLFKDELKAREKQYEKVTIKESLLLDGGEIPRDWLKRYHNFTTWKDFSYECSHCNMQIKSLNGLLSHVLIESLCVKKSFIYAPNTVHSYDHNTFFTSCQVHEN